MKERGKKNWSANATARRGRTQARHHNTCQFPYPLQLFHDASAAAPLGGATAAELRYRNKSGTLYYLGSMVISLGNVSLVKI